MSTEQVWYIAENGASVGPLSKDDLVAQLGGHQGPDTVVFGPVTNGEWIKARQVRDLIPAQSASLSGPPPPPSGLTADEIDFELFGDDMQFVEVTLDPGETVIAEAGSMMYMSQGIQMETVMGDPNKKGAGIMDKLKDAGKRVLTGESLFLTTFTASGSAREVVSFAAPYPGKIIPMHIEELGGEILCQKDSFLAAAKGIEVGIALQKNIGAGLFGGEGFILQRLRGDGLAFVHAGGTIHKKELASGETLRLDTGCLVAFQPTVDYNIQMTGGLKNSVLGGEGMFLATLTGPGTVWMQSLPFSRLARRMLSGATKNKGEGSVLGGLGNLFEQR